MKRLLVTGNQYTKKVKIIYLINYLINYLIKYLLLRQLLTP